MILQNRINFVANRIVLRQFVLFLPFLRTERVSFFDIF